MPTRPGFVLMAVCLAATFSVSTALAQMAPAATGSTSAAAPALTTPAEGSVRAMQTAMQRMNANDVDGALAELTTAITLNPHNSGAYVLRGSVYTQKKMWAQAEDDFKSAQEIAPDNVVVKFNIVELKFMQKEYDAARPGFAALEHDPDMGDLASYKVFLCDLFGGHTDQAKQELDAFNKADENPSYYFSNAAWALVHKDIETARGWLVSASHIYPLRKNAYYAQSLRDLGFLPIPPPKSE